MIKSYHLVGDKGTIIATICEPVTGQIQIFDRETGHAIYVDKDHLIQALIALQEDARHGQH